MKKITTFGNAYSLIKWAWGNSTMNNNLLIGAIKKIAWDETYKCPDGFCFILDDWCIDFEELDPFKNCHNPSWINLETGDLLWINGYSPLLYD